MIKTSSYPFRNMSSLIRETQLISMFCLLGVVLCHSRSLLAGDELRALPVLNSFFQIGQLYVASHSIQMGDPGSSIDLVNEGGQGNLALYRRWGGQLKLSNNLELTTFYQDFNLETKDLLQRNLIIDGASWGENTPIDVHYYFPFLRFVLSYKYSYGLWSYGVGGALQIRNANIVISTSNGEKRAIRRDIGPVGLLHLEASYRLDHQTLSLSGDLIGSPGEKDRGGNFYDIQWQHSYHGFRGYHLSWGLQSFTGGYAGNQRTSYKINSRFTSNWLSLYSLFVGVTLLEI